MGFLADLPDGSASIRLARISPREELILCETVTFDGGRPVVDMMLRRAQLAGRVEPNGEIQNHFADIMDESGYTLLTTVALDAKSYSILKNHWMRCRVQVFRRKERSDE